MPITKPILKIVVLADGELWRVHNLDQAHINIEFIISGAERLNHSLNKEVISR